MNLGLDQNSGVKKEPSERTSGRANNQGPALRNSSSDAHFIAGGYSEAAMRLLLFLSGICVGIVCIGNHAEAQNYPWCALYRDGVWNCGFTTFEQCQLPTGEMVGSAYKITPISLLPDHAQERTHDVPKAAANS